MSSLPPSPAVESDDTSLPPPSSSSSEDGGDGKGEVKEVDHSLHVARLRGLTLGDVKDRGMRAIEVARRARVRARAEVSAEHEEGRDALVIGLGRRRVLGAEAVLGSSERLMELLGDGEGGSVVKSSVHEQLARVRVAVESLAELYGANLDASHHEHHPAGSNFGRLQAALVHLEGALPPAVPGLRSTPRPRSSSPMASHVAESRAHIAAARDRVRARSPQKHAALAAGFLPSPTSPSTTTPTTPTTTPTTTTTQTTPTPTHMNTTSSPRDGGLDGVVRTVTAARAEAEVAMYFLPMDAILEDRIRVLKGKLAIAETKMKDVSRVMERKEVRDELEKTETERRQHEEACKERTEAVAKEMQTMVRRDMQREIQLARRQVADASRAAGIEAYDGGKAAANPHADLAIARAWEGKECRDARQKVTKIREELRERVRCIGADARLEAAKVAGDARRVKAECTAMLREAAAARTMAERELATVEAFRSKAVERLGVLRDELSAARAQVAKLSEQVERDGRSRQQAVEERNVALARLRDLEQEAGKMVEDTEEAAARKRQLGAALDEQERAIEKTEQLLEGSGGGGGGGHEGEVETLRRVRGEMRRVWGEVLGTDEAVVKRDHHRRCLLLSAELARRSLQRKRRAAKVAAQQKILDAARAAHIQSTSNPLLHTPSDREDECVERKEDGGGGAGEEVRTPSGPDGSVGWMPKELRELPESPTMDELHRAIDATGGAIAVREARLSSLEKELARLVQRESEEIELMKASHSIGRVPVRNSALKDSIESLRHELARERKEARLLVEVSKRVLRNVSRRRPQKDDHHPPHSSSSSTSTPSLVREGRGERSGGAVVVSSSPDSPTSSSMATAPLHLHTMNTSATTSIAITPRSTLGLSTSPDARVATSPRPQIRLFGPDAVSSATSLPSTTTAPTTLVTSTASSSSSSSSSPHFLPFDRSDGMTPMSSSPTRVSSTSKAGSITVEIRSRGPPRERLAEGKRFLPVSAADTSPRRRATMPVQLHHPPSPSHQQLHSKPLYTTTTTPPPSYFSPASSVAQEVEVGVEVEAPHKGDRSVAVGYGASPTIPRTYRRRRSRGGGSPFHHKEGSSPARIDTRASSIRLHSTLTAAEKSRRAQVVRDLRRRQKAIAKKIEPLQRSISSSPSSAPSSSPHPPSTSSQPPPSLPHSPYSPSRPARRSASHTYSSPRLAPPKPPSLPSPSRPLSPPPIHTETSSTSTSSLSDSLRIPGNSFAADAPIVGTSSPVGSPRARLELASRRAAAHGT